MPIKFRCSYCRQFLGISRAQAGGVVDCPSCGRSIRVPLLDGTVQPVLDPELNLEDTHLARALDELARLVDAPVQKYVPLNSSSSAPDESESENQIPQPLPEPIPIEMPLPPTPVIVQPPTNAVLNAPTGNGVVNEGSLLAELATLSAGLSAFDRTEIAASESRSAPRRRKTELSPLILAVIGLVTFLAGMLTERFVRVFEGMPHGNGPAKNRPKSELVESELTGRITYKTKEGQNQPDRGARILVFPVKRTGVVKLSVIGFRPSDDPVDQSVANSALKALGGAATRTDDLGQFKLPVDAGSYHLLVLSHFQPQNDSANDPALDKLLSEYFEKPEDLLGRVQHQFSPLRITGTGNVWDHSF